MMARSDEQTNEIRRKKIRQNTLIAFFTYHFPVAICFLGRYLDLTQLSLLSITYIYLLVWLTTGIFLLAIQLKRNVTRRFAVLLTHAQLFNWLVLATIWFYLIQGIRVIGLFASLFPLMFAFRYGAKPFSYALVVFTIIDYLLMAYIGIHISGQDGSFTREILHVCIYFPMALFIAYMANQLRQQHRKLRKALSDLEAMQAQLIQSEKMAALSELVAGVAHEINTPIGIALTSTSHIDDKNQWVSGLFETNQLRRSELQKYLKLVSGSVRLAIDALKRSADLVNTFKQVATDAASEKPRKFDLRENVVSIVNSFSQVIDRSGHKISLECPENLIIESYPSAFSQMIAHLINNSLIHGFEEMKSGHIMINISGENNYIVLRYRDNGKGMMQETLEKMFNPFFTTKRSVCTGLGMHILFNIVTQIFKGRMETASSPGNGVRIRIILPLT